MQYLAAGVQVDHHAIQDVLMHLAGEAWDFHRRVRGGDDRLVVFEDRMRGLGWSLGYGDEAKRDYSGEAQSEGLHCAIILSAQACAGIQFAQPTGRPDAASAPR
jgi:hypothetical protein